MNNIYYTVLEKCELYDPNKVVEREYLFTTKELAERYIDFLYTLEKTILDCLTFEVSESKEFSDLDLTQILYEGYEIVDGLDEGFEISDLIYYNERQFE